MMLGMLSMLIVSPFITSNKEIYGIYAVCLSLTVFFAYADIGFVSASLKFSAEAYIKGDKKLEMSILGFSTMVLLVIMGFLSVGIFMFAYNPQWLIQGLSGNNSVIATRLLFILACSTPVYCFRRILGILFSVRMQDYYFQLLNIIGSSVNIALAPVFFLNGNYDIVGYFLTSQLIQFIVLIFAFIVAQRKMKVNIWLLFRNIRWSHQVYNLLSGLAYASLFLTICWVLFYEIDNIVISRLLGAEAVAVFAVAFSILAVFRNLFGIMFGPFQTRFNYFVGLDDFQGLHVYAKNIIRLFMPICIVPIIVVVITSRPFIYSWVGSAYEESAILLSILLMCNILAFMSYPSGIYITAVKKQRYMYNNGVIMLVFYWVGVFTCYKTIGVLSFGVMKTLAMIISSLYYFFIMFSLMNDSAIKFLRGLLLSYFFPTSICIVLCILVEPYMFLEKGREYLILNLVIIICLLFFSYLIYWIFCPLLRSEFRTILNAFIKGKN